jgi:hypothetical protein
MSSTKARQLWTVNILSFVLFMVLAVSGLINFLLIPGGYRGEGSALTSLRHFFRVIHEWTALLYLAVVIIHLMMHWPYITSNLKKYGIKEK